MSGVGFFELVILFMIGLVVLGPKRLPKVANQLGTWIGQARRMTRVMKRQLEEELDLSEDFKDLKNIKDDLVDDLTIGPAAAHIPRDDDNYSPLHDEASPDVTSPNDTETVSVPPDDAEKSGQDSDDEDGAEGKPA